MDFQNTIYTVQIFITESNKGWKMKTFNLDCFSFKIYSVILYFTELKFEGRAQTFEDCRRTVRENPVFKKIDLSILRPSNLAPRALIITRTSTVQTCASSSNGQLNNKTQKMAHEAIDSPKIKGNWQSKVSTGI